jgi:hypothetical protein
MRRVVVPKNIDDTIRGFGLPDQVAEALDAYLRDTLPRRYVLSKTDRVDSDRFHDTDYVEMYGYDCDSVDYMFRIIACDTIADDLLLVTHLNCTRRSKK